MKSTHRQVWALAGILGISCVAAAGAAELSRYEAIIKHYEAIRLSLVEDSIESVRDHAEAIHRTVADSQPTRRSESPEPSIEPDSETQLVLREIGAVASQLAKASDLESARQGFLALTEPMVQYRKITGDESTIIAYCSMAEQTWIQREVEIGNPYFGQQMPKCGEIVSGSE